MNIHDYPLGLLHGALIGVGACWLCAVLNAAVARWRRTS